MSKRRCPHCGGEAKAKRINLRTLNISCTKCSWITNKTFVRKGVG